MQPFHVTVYDGSPRRTRLALLPFELQAPVAQQVDPYAQLTRNLRLRSLIDCRQSDRLELELPAVLLARLAFHRTPPSEQVCSFKRVHQTWARSVSACRPRDLGDDDAPRKFRRLAGCNGRA